MKYLALLFISCTISILSAQTWEPMANLPDEIRVHHGVGFALEGKGYIVTGSSENQNTSKVMYEYNPKKDQWIKRDDFPGASRSFAIGDTYEGKAYMGFGVGQNNDDLNDLWVYDPADSSWTELASCECIGRAHPSFVAHQGKIYVGLGNDIGGNLNDWWIYDIETNSWTEGAQFPAARRHHPYHFQVGDYVYTGLGHGDMAIFAEWYQYNPATDSWTQVESIPAEARVAGTQFEYDERGYVLSGDGSDHWVMPTGEFWQYDPTTDSWTEMPPHPSISRWAPTSFIIEDTLYFMAGLERQPTAYPDAAWKFPFFSIRHTMTELPTCDNDSTGALFLTVNGRIDSSLRVKWSTGDTGIYLEQLAPGSYEAVIISGMDTFQYEAIVNPAFNTRISPDVEHVMCANEATGRIALNYSGTVDPVQIRWSTGDTGRVLDNLTAGVYHYSFFDGTFCDTIVDSVVIEEPEPIEVLLDTIINEGSASEFTIVFTIQGGMSFPLVLLVNEEGDTLSTRRGEGQFAGLPEGVYSIIVNDRSGCTITLDNILVERTNSILEGYDRDFQIFPNPVRDRLQLLIESPNKEFIYQLRTSIGHHIPLQQVRTITSGTVEIALPNLPTGMYWLTIQDEGRLIESLPFIRIQ